MASLPSIASAPPYAASATSTEPRTSLSTFTTVRAIRASRPMETRAVAMEEARRAGLKLIVIDPVRTQTAENADLFLQPLPGHDAAIFAALLNIILREGWHDAPFCAAHVAGLDDLARAVAAFDPALVEARAGIRSGQLLHAATMFARDGRRGCAGGGTGPNMADHSNLAEHLIETLNVVCGRVLRAGEPAPRRPVRSVRLQAGPGSGSGPIGGLRLALRLALSRRA